MAGSRNVMSSFFSSPPPPYVLGAESRERDRGGSEGGRRNKFVQFNFLPRHFLFTAVRKEREEGRKVANETAGRKEANCPQPSQAAQSQITLRVRRLNVFNWQSFLLLLPS